MKKLLALVLLFSAAAFGAPPANLNNPVLTGTVNLAAQTANSLLYVDGSKNVQSAAVGSNLSWSAGTLNVAASLVGVNSVTAASSTDLTLTAGSGNQGINLVPTGTGYIRLFSSSFTNNLGTTSRQTAAIIGSVPGWYLSTGGASTDATMFINGTNGQVYFDIGGASSAANNILNFRTAAGASSYSVGTVVSIGNGANGVVTITSNTAANAGIAWGSDCTIYRTAANTLATAANFAPASSGAYQLGTSSNMWLYAFVSSNLYTASVVANAAGQTLNLSGYSAAGTAIALVDNQTYAQTSGAKYFTTVTDTFNPTSGTGTYGALELLPTINQTGGANGASYSIFFSPTLTAAANYNDIGGASTLKLATNGTTAITISSSQNTTLAGSITTAAGLTAAAAARYHGGVRTSTGLSVSTTTGIQEEVGGTLYTLAVLTTNP